jgi:hypothetical protein
MLNYNDLLAQYGLPKNTPKSEFLKLIETKTPILEYLEDKRIVSFEFSEDKKSISISECCDMYFTRSLDVDTFQMFVDELSSMLECLKGECHV